MGTNYYVRFGEHTEEQICNLGHKHEVVVRNEIHIGKQSYGWKFLFNPYKGSRSLWIDFLYINNDSIYDEYGTKISYIELMDVIERTQKSGITLAEYKRSGISSYNNPEVHEFIDSEGYRISKNKEFS